MSQITTPLLDSVTYQYDKMWPSTRLLFHKGLIPMYTFTKTLFPSHAYLARASGLSVTQVKKCIKQAIALGALRVKRELGKRTLIYEIGKNFVESCILIDACHFKMNWKKHRLGVIKDLSEDELFFAKLLKKRGQLSTTKVPTSLLAKVPTIRILSSLSDPLFVNTRVEEPSAGREQAVNSSKETPKPIKEGSPYLWGLKLKEKDRESLTFRNSPLALKEARKSFDYLRHKKDVEPYNHAAMMITLLKKQQFRYSESKGANQ